MVLFNVEEFYWEDIRGIFDIIFGKEKDFQGPDLKTGPYSSSLNNKERC